MSAIKEYMMDEAEVLVHKMSKKNLSEEDLHFQFEHILTNEQKLNLENSWNESSTP